MGIKAKHGGNIGRAIIPRNMSVFCVRATVVLMLCSPVARASDELLPRAESILDRFVEVTGGKEAYAKFNNSVMVESAEIEGSDFEATITTYRARPNLRYVESYSAKFGTGRGGCDGKTVWEWGMNGEPVMREDEMSYYAGLREAHFDRVAGWRELWETVETIGEEEVRGRKCYKVLLSHPLGRPATHYYDKETGLLVRAQITWDAQNRMMEIDNYFDDYQEAEGVRVPVQKEAIVGNSVRRYQTISLSHNVTMAPDQFHVPSEVLAITSGAVKSAKILVGPFPHEARVFPAATLGNASAGPTAEKALPSDDAKPLETKPAEKPGGDPVPSSPKSAQP